MKSNLGKGSSNQEPAVQRLAGEINQGAFEESLCLERVPKREIREESHSLMQKHLRHPLKEFRLYSASTKRLLTIGAVGKSYSQLRGTTDCSEENQTEERRKPSTHQSRFDLPVKFLSNLTLLNSSPPLTCN